MMLSWRAAGGRWWSAPVFLILLVVMLSGCSAEQTSGHRSNFAGCAQCEIRQEQKRNYIESLKAQILMKLGMDRPPNVTGLPKVSDDLINSFIGKVRSENGGHHNFGYVNDMHYSPYDEEEDEEHSQTEKILTFATRPPRLSEDMTGKLPLDRLMYFDLAERYSDLHLNNATLRLYMRHKLVGRHHHHQHQRRGHHQHASLENAPDDKQPEITIHIDQVVWNGDSYTLKEAMVETIRLVRDEPGYVAVNITWLVAEWFRRPDDNIGIQVRAYDQRGHQRKNLLADLRHSQPDALPILEVAVGSDQRRQKRTAGSKFCSEDNAEPNCCLYPLLVNFHEFGWDWIIAPTWYQANYCSGNCPYVFLQQYPHTHIVQQKGGTRGPCCAPKRMAPIHMVFWDVANHIRFAKLPNMVVESCGCH